MKLLDNLEGVTQSTFPRHPIGILNEMIQQARCTLEFEYRENYSDDSTAATETSRGGGRNDAASGGTGVGCATTGGGGSRGGPRAEASRTFHGCAKVRAMNGLRAVQISGEVSSGTKRAVRALCCEQVLLRIHEDDAYLQRLVVEAKKAVGVTAEGTEGESDGESSTFETASEGESDWETEWPAGSGDY